MGLHWYGRGDRGWLRGTQHFDADNLTQSEMLCPQRPRFCTSPKTDLIDATYELPAPEVKTTVAVKIIDMLGEEVLVIKELIKQDAFTS